MSRLFDTQKSRGQINLEIKGSDQFDFAEIKGSDPEIKGSDQFDFGKLVFS
jgi:hypothetical protein